MSSFCLHANPEALAPLVKQRLLDVWAAVDKRIIYYFINAHFGRWSSNTHIFVSIE